MDNNKLQKTIEKAEKGELDIMDMSEELEELETYADLEGTEVGELCHSLITVSHYPDYMDEVFEKALIKEILSQLVNFKNNATIVEKDETYTQKTKRIEWD